MPPSVHGSSVAAPAQHLAIHHGAADLVRRSGGELAAWERELRIFAGASLALALIGLILWPLDARTIGGAPAWLKPIKFGISNAIFAASLGWYLRWIPQPGDLARRAARVTVVVLTIENVLIALQAARGVRSHFNASTPFDAAVVSMMGIAITTLMIVSVRVLVALCRTRFEDAAWKWIVRAGFAITLIGASFGGIMTQPSAAQITTLRTTYAAPVIGGHTVGAPDGGPSMPVTGWSTTHGDLRVPHFAGLHAMQLLPLVFLALARGVASPRRRLWMARVVTISYAGLVLLLLVQALRGESVAALPLP
ncbi:MAG: hypothetical protein V4617_01160 [Gemmatimonadota bacterium]